MNNYYYSKLTKKHLFHFGDLVGESSKWSDWVHQSEEELVRPKFLLWKKQVEELNGRQRMQDDEVKVEVEEPIQYATIEEVDEEDEI